MIMLLSDLAFLTRSLLKEYSRSIPAQANRIYTSCLTVLQFMWIDLNWWIKLKLTCEQVYKSGLKTVFFCKHQWGAAPHSVYKVIFLIHMMLASLKLLCVVTRATTEWGPLLKKYQFGGSFGSRCIEQGMNETFKFWINVFGCSVGLFGLTVEQMNKTN